MNVAAFAVIVARERETGARRPHRLGRRDRAARGPWLAWPLTIAMLALAGIPATGGFIGKFYAHRARSSTAATRGSAS